MQQREHLVEIPAGKIRLEGNLALPPGAKGIVLFAHGSGSGRHSPRNRYVAQVLQDTGIATLLFDLLTEQEEAQDRVTGHLRFNIPLLAERVSAATAWATHDELTKRLRIGYFGASTGAAAALVAAAERDDIAAIVSRGGRPDLAEEALERVTTPTLLIVGGYDAQVIELNQAAMRQMRAVRRLRAEVELKIVPRASHLFEEPGKLEEVARLAAEWFGKHL